MLVYAVAAGLIVLGLVLLVVFLRKPPVSVGPGSTGPPPPSAWQIAPPQAPCSVYTFQAKPTGPAINGAVPAILGNPTLNVDIIDQMTGSSDFPPCLDVDQLVLQKRQRTCVNNYAKGPSMCIKSDGTRAAFNEGEFFYDPKICAIDSCDGTLALISLSGPQCLHANGCHNKVSVDNPCDPSVQAQLFRVTRAIPGTKAGEYTINQGGALAQIKDRVSGCCLGVDTSTNQVVLDSCLVSNGFVWHFAKASGDTPAQLVYVGNAVIPTDPTPQPGWNSVQVVNNVVSLQPYTTAKGGPGGTYVDYVLYNLSFFTPG